MMVRVRDRYAAKAQFVGRLKGPVTGYCGATAIGDVIGGVCLKFRLAIEELRLPLFHPKSQISVR